MSFYRRLDWGDLRHGIFTRQGGVSQAPWHTLNMGASIGDDLAAVRENHARLYRAVEAPGERAVSCWLVHSADTLVVTEETRRQGGLRKADALITNLPDTPLVMRYADCVPLLFYDRSKRAIGLGHAGWRGTVQGMAARMARMMQSNFGCQPRDIEAVLGPAISRRNYRVGEDLVARANAYFGADAGLIWRDPVDRAPYFDLWRANRLDLERIGVRQIQVLDICTYENTGEFYSHRAENGCTGRFGVVMCL